MIFFVCRFNALHAYVLLMLKKGKTESESV